MAQPADVHLTRNISVPMRDGVELRGDLYLPVGDGPFPCMLSRTPYVKDYNPGIWVVCDPLKAAGAGFAVFIQDVRGRGRSDGDFTPFIDEGPDGADTIAWAAEQEWCDGRVVMYGSSYMAASQWQAAKEGAPALRAMAPFQASSDYFEGRSYRGGAFEIGALLGVSLNALGGGIAHRKIKRGELPPSAARDARAAVNDLATLARTPLDELRKTVLSDIAPFFFDWATWTDPDHEYWRALDMTGHHDDINIPVFHLASWFDQAATGTLKNFQAMRAESNPARDDQYLLMGPWSHRIPRGSTVGQYIVGDQFYGTSAIFDFDSLLLRWMRAVLDGEGDPWPFDGRVRYFTTGINEWRTADDWPIPNSEVRQLFFSGDELAWEAAPDTAERTFVHDPDDPVPTRGGAHMTPEAVVPAGPVDQTDVQARDDVLVWTSPPLTDPVEVTGWVEATLVVAHDADRADYSVVVSDLEPDGLCTNVVDGYQRVSESRSGQEVPVRLGSTSHVFRAGHCIRVHIAGASTPRHDVVGTPGSPQKQSILAGSRLELPIPPPQS